MCFSITKLLLFAFNFVFWLAGGTMLGVGIWLYLDPGALESIKMVDLGSSYDAVVFLMMIAGAIMMIVGFCGCFGAIKESTCLLGTYVAFLSVIFALEIGTGIYAFVVYGDLQTTINKSMANLHFNETYTDEIDAIVTMEQKLQCCGATKGCSDWNSSENLTSYGCACEVSLSSKNDSNCVLANTLPDSCSPDANLETNSNGTKYIYVQSCSEATYNVIEDNFLIIGIVTLVIGCTQVLGIIVTLCFCCSIKNENGVYPE